MIALDCPACGGNRFAYPPDLGDESRIECEGCGHDVGSLAELKARIVAEVARRAAERG